MLQLGAPGEPNRTLTGPGATPAVTSTGSAADVCGQSVPPEATNPNLVDHDSHSMPGMASEAEMQRLAA
ncbi:MAG: hypothetical protein ACRCSN_16645, partial [Dermatophilaceae bacterium]